MLSSGILWSLLLIPLSTANRGFTKCKGESTTLNCLEPNNHIGGKVEINALWKKHSGERVIWKYNGDSQKGASFTNRTVELKEDLSLYIHGCDQSDQGTYILCIDGKPRCEVTLHVRDSKKCKPKTTTEQSVRSTAFSMAKQATKDEKHLETETSLPNAYVRWVIYACLCLVVVVLLLFICVTCVIRAYIPKEKTSKSDKSGSKLLPIYNT